MHAEAHQRHAALLGLIVATAALVGCLGGDAQRSVTCPAPGVATFHAPLTGGGELPRAPGEPVAFVFWATNPTVYDARVTVTEPGPEAADHAWLWPTVGPQDRLVTEVASNETTWGAFSSTRGTNVTLQAELSPASPVDAGVAAGGERGPGLHCDLGGVHRETVALEAVEDTDQAQAGRGVLVHTVGWWVNGSSFYTNLDRYDERDDVPKGYLGAYGGGDALPVYVYDESRDEMPPRYEDAGYVTTIPGFNEALKGIPTVGARLVLIDPPDAYTREGSEDHPLYGDALVFYIEAIEVTEVPCTVPEPVCDRPRLPAVPCEPVCEGVDAVGSVPDLLDAALRSR